MSFLSQCVFYFINSIITILLGDTLSIDIADYAKYILVGVSFIMFAIASVAVVKLKKQAPKYLDIPLIFLCNVVTVVFGIYVSKTSFLSLIPGIVSFVPSVFLAVRIIMWIVNVAKGKRKPQKKNVIVLVAYILTTAVLCSLAYLDFSKDEEKPTTEEMQLLEDCYGYLQLYLQAIPTDKTELQRIDDVTAKVTVNGVFARGYEKSDFYKKSNGGILIGTAKKEESRKTNYANVVALRLKTLIALNDYTEYNKFFVENCGYLFYADPDLYLDLWVNDTYNLDDGDFNAIISGYKKALELCDNDSDRLFIIHTIIDFFNEYQPNNTELEKFKKMRSDIYDSNNYEELLEIARNNRGYVSEKLTVE